METLTDRLVLTPIGPEHIADLSTLYADPNVAHWTGPWTEASIGVWATAAAARWRTDGVGKWIAHRRSDGTLVGRGGLSRATVDGVRRLELGWVVRDALRGQGFATEIGAAGLAYAFDTLDASEVVAFTEIHNRASRAVMERLEMVFVKVIAAPGLVEGREGVHPDAPFAQYRSLRPLA